MVVRACLFVTGVAVVATLALAACAPMPAPDTPATVDSDFAIPPGSVPPGMQRPDGLLINGLLPAQPDDGS